MSKTLVVLILILAAPAYASRQVLKLDPARDAAFRTAVQAFLENVMTGEQLEAELGEYARAFEKNPYKLTPLKIDFEKVPQERLFALVRITARITGPTQEAFMRGDLSPAQAAAKVAPFFLMWAGYGIDPPPGDPVAAKRIREFLDEIGNFSATADDHPIK